jgi:hypothetical protein
VWSDLGVLVLAVAAGALAAAVVAVVRPGLLAQAPPVLVPVAAGVGAVVVALGDAAPTGWSVLDLVLRAGFGALVVLAASRAGPVLTAWLALTATVTLLLADAPMPGFAGVALGALLAVLASGDVGGRAHPARSAIAAVAAAAAVGPLAHLTWPVTTGASAAAVAVATLPVLVVGWVRASDRVRSGVGTGLAVVVLVLFLGSIVGAVAAVGASGDVDEAVRAATRGLDLLGDDDEAARDELAVAAEAFESAEGALTGFWAKPALLVPGVAQQSRAVSTMASAGADLARTAIEASAEADVDAVRPRDGQVDLAALANLVDPLDRSLTALRRTATRLDGVRSPLLVAPIADRLEDLYADVESALGSAELASQAVAVAPDLLGADGPRRYFLALQQPAESRALGGFLGSWGEIVTDRGRFELVRTGRYNDLRDGGVGPGNRTVEGGDELAARYGEDVPATWGLLGFSPDFPTVADLMAQLYPQSLGEEIDGVFAVDPAAFAAFLEITGPIDVPGYPQTLTAEDAERILLHEQYLEFPQQLTEEREQFLADAAEVLFDELTSGELPGPRGIADEVGPAVEGRHLMLWSRHRAEQALFERMGADGSIRRDGTDSFGITGQNFGGNKIDWFLRRAVNYDLTWDPGTGEVTGTVEVTLTNEAPDSGLPPGVISWGGDEGRGQTPIVDGENLMMLSLYSAFGVTDLTLDGEPLGQRGTGPEAGHQATSAYVSVFSGQTRTVRAEVAGTIEPSSRYRIAPVRQATVVPDDLTVHLRLAEGWEVTAAEGATTVGQREVEADWTAAEPRLLTVDVGRPGGDRDDRGLLDRLRGR